MGCLQSRKKQFATEPTETPDCEPNSNPIVQHGPTTIEHNEKMKEMQDHINRQKKEHESTLTSMKKEHEEKIQEMQKYKLLLEQNNRAVSRLNQQIVQLEAEKKEIMLRFSAMFAASISSNNPNITDLSDLNRPTKLAEDFLQLYDNEWTDAFEFLKNEGQNDEDACSVLLEVLTKIYSVCKEVTSREFEAVGKAVKIFLGMDVLPVEIQKQLMDNRKMTYKNDLMRIKQTIKEPIREIVRDKLQRKAIKKYIEQAVELCWLMTIQDPPVFLEYSTNIIGEPLDTNVFKTFTKSGKLINYIVWPVLYLYEGGAILSKGVAQGANSKKSLELSQTDKVRKSSSTMSNEALLNDDKMSLSSKIKNDQSPIVRSKEAVLDGGTASQYSNIKSDQSPIVRNKDALQKRDTTSRYSNVKNDNLPIAPSNVALQNSDSISRFNNEKKNQTTIVVSNRARLDNNDIQATVL